MFKIANNQVLKRYLTSSIYKVKKVNINGFQESIIKGGTNKFNLLNKGFRDIKQIGIIGWGSQAPSQALNLKDSLHSIGSDINIKIGLRENSNSLKEIKDFETGTINEVLNESDFNIILISDYAQSILYQDIFDNVRPGTTLGFSHGFLLGHLNNINKKFPKDINVVMMAPKGMGPTLRDKYLEGSGINSSISVHRDIDDNATDIALSWAIGVGSPYVFNTSMKKEYISDIFGERAILLGGVHGIVEYLYRKYTNIFSYDSAFIRSVGSLTGPISQKISEVGLLKLYNDMSPRDRMTFKINYTKSYNISYNLFEEIYEEVRNGNEIRSVISTSDKEMSKIGESQMWQVGEKCYENFRVSENDNLTEEIEPMTAGMYIGAMMAQIDILIRNNHCYSEIVNESIIEATDSLNPYMNRRGISYMIDNCSTTARLGARKWAPRLDYLYEQNMDRFNSFDGFNFDMIYEDLEGIRNDYDIFSKFENHKIHKAFDTIKSLSK